MISYRAIIAWPLCWAFYLVGDAISRIKFLGLWEWPWTIYRGVMVYSSELQEWAGVSDGATNSYWPWSKADGDQA